MRRLPKFSRYFLNVNGDELLQPDSETIEFHSENIISRLISVAAEGVEVIVCPHCLEALGIDKKEVTANYKISNEEIMMNRLSNNSGVFQLLNK